MQTKLNKIEISKIAKLCSHIIINKKKNTREFREDKVVHQI